jgi:hypothetical protein
MRLFGFQKYAGCFVCALALLPAVAGGLIYPRRLIPNQQKLPS